jgi:preprotein translocase subunit SecD
VTLLKNLRIITLLVFIVLAVVAVNPRPWQDGATIRAVDRDSAAAAAGMTSPEPRSTPVLRERIIAVDGIPIQNEQEFVVATRELPANVSLRVETNKKTYTLTTQPLLNVTVLDELETVTVEREEYNATSGVFETYNETVTRNKTISTVIGVEPIGLTVYDAPRSNIRLGLDLSGGARVLVQPTEDVDAETMDVVVETIKQRLNVFGLADVTVRPVSDLAGNQYVLVEVAGATERDVRELVLTQGKFEAKIGNEVVLRGGRDITYVCRSPECSGISQQQGCAQSAEGYSCAFQFSMTMTPEAGEKQANATSRLSIVNEGGQQYLNESLELYLDDTLVDSLLIGASLKGSPTTQIAISGGGSGPTQRAAIEDTLYQMKQLQTVLITGSLPVKLEIVKTDSISAELGEEFISNALLVGVLAFLAVTVTLMVRYQRIRIAVPVLVTLLSEIIIILGVAALLGWNLDLAAMAGILIAIGTGVDDQIVIADEVLSRKGRSESASWRDKLKKAFFIIFTSYATGMAAMLPLLFAGAGLVKGFALTTMIGITIGVLITRPAFAVIIEHLEKK